MYNIGVWLIYKTLYKIKSSQRNLKLKTKNQLLLENTLTAKAEHFFDLNYNENIYVTDSRNGNDNI